jgi:hypothetical protein
MTNSNNDIKIVRTQIEAKSRKLKASWTVESPTETEILTIMSQDLQRDIDWSVLCKIDPGRKNWIEIPFSKSAQAAGDAVIEAWAKEAFNNRGYYVFSDRILFCRNADAEFFMLRWS